MTNRRRNLIVLALVLALLAGSAWVIATKPTVEGLDLRGGTELVYQGRATPQVPDVQPEDIDRAIEIIRERVDTLGVSEPEISRLGTDQIEVGLPDVQDTEPAIDQHRDHRPALLLRLRAERDPAQPGRHRSGGSGPTHRLYRRGRGGIEAQAGVLQDTCTTNGPTYYLFDEDTLEPLGEPSETRQDLYLPFGGKKPPNSRVIAVPQGTVVVEEKPVDDPATADVDESTLATRSSSCSTIARRCPATTSRNPEQNFDPTTNQPNVTFDFTDSGRAAFQEVTREIALRGRMPTSTPPAHRPARPTPTPPPSSPRLRDRPRRPDVSRPIINFKENPDGIDGRTGAQISGSFEASRRPRTWPSVLQIGALPIKLALISQSTVSATLGQQALDQGLKAGIVGLLIVLIFLLVYYRFLGVIAVLGLAVYAVFFFALIKLIPITLTLPGIAGLILTIGVAADSNIVIFERIKEEIRAGRSMLSAISEGYKKGIATIIDANVITLLTAFILFVLATAGVKGFAFTLGIGTIVSLFTAVLFTQAVLGLLGRSPILRSPELPRRER